ncbi:MAG: hypothetical protein R2746_01220 [Acidimicrobiales bacterium]
MVDAIVRSAASRLELPARRRRSSPSSVAEAVITQVDGSHFVAPVAPAPGVQAPRPMSHGRHHATVTPPGGGHEPPDKGGVVLSVLGRGVEGNLLPIEAAIADGKAASPRRQARPARRILPALLRPGAQRRGQVYLSQDEAWGS